MEFRCRFVDASGVVLKDDFTASDELELRKTLKKRGLLVLGIRRKGFLGFLGELYRPKDSLKGREFIVFNDELATLLSAGITIVEALDILRHRIESPGFKFVLDDVAERVRSGEALSEAFRNTEQKVSGVYVATLLAGEKSGNIEDVIRGYVRHERLIGGVRSKAISALIYPGILMVLSLGVVGIIVLNVVPAFSAFYGGLGAELPVMTRAIVTVSKVFIDYLSIFVLLFFTLVFSFLYATKTQGSRLIMDRLLLRLPLVGSLVVKFKASQISRTLSTLLAGGIPLVSALEVVHGSVGNTFLARQLQGVTRDVKEGTALSTAMGKTRVFPPVGLKMVEVGESTGSLKEMLESVSDFFDEEIETSLDRLMTLLEPVLLVLMGIVIAVMLVALYMPLLQLGTLL